MPGNQEEGAPFSMNFQGNTRILERPSGIIIIDRNQKISYDSFRDMTEYEIGRAPTLDSFVKPILIFLSRDKYSSLQENNKSYQTERPPPSPLRLPLSS